MKTEHALPGYLAVALALLFPVYWVSVLGAGGESLFETIRDDVMRLNGWDALFVLIGAIEIYLYLSLRKILAQRLNTALPAVLLLMMAIVVGVFHATVLFDLAFAAGPEFDPATAEQLVLASMVVGIAGLFVYAVLALVLSITLLRASAESPTLLKVFAILLLACCVLQFTIVFGFINLALFPVALLVLAAFFLRGEHAVEVV
ncbi:hypothetical protein [Thioalkalivibrio sp. XN8]|uniref:hypothetical protein n=1 Tax=Thioalkalivibrio sp. XN8 TaxID=2712863 RepID=UPI0013EC561B|nr:hypothetical protein [Thioalkalivibrio sp. XN8]NGP53024.1 hypothetical protein [Thioalkalivibrio sp. XN8]